MIRDLQIGPLCRLFGRDAAEAAARLDGVRAWMGDMAEALGPRLKHAFAWHEDPGDEPARVDLGDGGLAALRLTAVYADRTDLDLPSELPDPLILDRVFRAAEEGRFARSNYGHLLAAQAWVPPDFDFTCAVPRPDGEDWTIGSLPALRDQLVFLAQRTVGVGPESLRDTGALSDRVLGAFLRAVAVMHDAAQQALRRDVPLVLLDR